MAQCAYCKKETSLYEGGVPVCLECAEGRDAKREPNEIVRAILIQDVVEATTRAHAASEAFSAVLADVPSGLPHPDGRQRIYDISRELSAAREQRMRAHKRLNEFLKSGTIPEDLKQGGGSA